MVLLSEQLERVGVQYVMGGVGDHPHQHAVVAVGGRLPELHEAMEAGGLDEKRAEVFPDWTAKLSDEHAHAVIADLLPLAVLDAEEQLGWTAPRPNWAKWTRNCRTASVPGRSRTARAA
jgi:hypothetical protein